jgi:hypothetical protein
MDKSTLARFQVKTVRLANGCLHWKAAKSKGYGRFREGGRLRQAHVVAWEHVNGPVPPGMDVDHKCHNMDRDCPGGECAHRACVEVSHLGVEARRRNLLLGRGIDRNNSQKECCPQGHPYDESNTYRTAKGRYCRSCHTSRTVAAKKAKRINCPQGHPYNNENTKITKNGRRFCLKCGVAKAEMMRSGPNG